MQTKLISIFILLLLTTQISYASPPRTPYTEPSVHLYNLANAAQRAGQLNRAVSLYKKAIKLAPNYAAPYFNCSVAYYKLNNFTEAERLLRKVLELEPNRFDVWEQYGSVLAAENRLADAKVAYAKAGSLHMTPAQQELHVNNLQALKEQEQRNNDKTGMRKTVGGRGRGQTDSAPVRGGSSKKSSP